MGLAKHSTSQKESATGTWANVAMNSDNRVRQDRSTFIAANSDSDPLPPLCGSSSDDCNYRATHEHLIDSSDDEDLHYNLAQIVLAMQQIRNKQKSKNLK